MNGSQEPVRPGARRILIDALNVAYWCGNPPALRLPLSLASGLLEAGHEVRLYFDASARHRLAVEADVYERLLRQSEYCIEVPSGRTADGVLLRDARASGACIVSRDRYRDYRRRYRKLIDDPARLMPGTVADDRLRVPELALDVPLLASVDTAMERLGFLVGGA